MTHITININHDDDKHSSATAEINFNKLKQELGNHRNLFDVVNKHSSYNGEFVNYLDIFENQSYVGRIFPSDRILTKEELEQVIESTTPSQKAHTLSDLSTINQVVPVYKQLEHVRDFKRMKILTKIHDLGTNVNKYFINSTWDKIEEANNVSNDVIFDYKLFNIK